VKTVRCTGKRRRGKAWGKGDGGLVAHQGHVMAPEAVEMFKSDKEEGAEEGDRFGLQMAGKSTWPHLTG